MVSCFPAGLLIKEKACLQIIEVKKKTKMMHLRTASEILLIFNPSCVSGFAVLPGCENSGLMGVKQLWSTSYGLSFKSKNS